MSSGVPSTEDERFLASVRKVLSGCPQLAAAYLYGSTARGGANLLSDRDLAILPVEGLSEPTRAALQRELAGRLGQASGGRPVDVRFFDELPLPVRGRVLQEGVLVVERDPGLRVQAEVRTRMDYHDFQHFERVGTADWVNAVRERLQRG